MNIVYKIKKEQAMDRINFFELTKEDADFLEFGKFSTEHENLRLIPSYLFDILPKGLEVVCLTGEKLIIGKDYIDDDARGGLLAYALHVK